MLTFDLLPLARHLDCEAEVQAYTGPFVGWRFLAALLREMPPNARQAGSWRRRKTWAVEAARAALAAQWSKYRAPAESAALAAEATELAMRTITCSGVPIPRQREILLGLMGEQNRCTSRRIKNS